MLLFIEQLKGNQQIIHSAKLNNTVYTTVTGHKLVTKL